MWPIAFTTAELLQIPRPDPFETHSEEKLLGTQTDRDLAGILRRPLNAVMTRRRQLGIPPFKAGWQEGDEA
jgi:hypothetical protein